MSGKLNDKERAARSVAALRDRHRKGTLSPQATAVLDSIRPGWNRTQKENWQATLSAVILWVAETGRMPRTHGESRGKREQVLGTWLSTQRHALTMGDEHYLTLNEKLPQWNETYADKWDATLEETILWSAGVGRSPRTKGKVMLEGERKLGVWLLVQRKTLTPADERYQTLDKRFPGWNPNAAKKHAPPEPHQETVSRRA